MALFYYFSLFISQWNGEVALLSCRIDTLDIEHRFLAGRSLFHDILQVVDGLDALVVHLLDDKALRHTSILQLATSDLDDLQSVADIQLLLLGVGDGAEATTQYICSFFSVADTV